MEKWRKDDKYLHIGNTDTLWRCLFSSSFPPSSPASFQPPAHSEEQSVRPGRITPPQTPAHPFVTSSLFHIRTPSFHVFLLQYILHFIFWPWLPLLYWKRSRQHFTESWISLKFYRSPALFVTFIFTFYSGWKGEQLAVSVCASFLCSLSDW